MPRIEKFEDIESWKKARVLASEVYRRTGSGSFSRDHGLRDQVRRAAVSVMANIAEGFGRDGDREFRQFLGHAKGSACEVKSHLYVALDSGFLEKEDFDKLYAVATDAENLIAGFMRYLNKGRYSGLKFRSVKKTET